VCVCSQFEQLIHSLSFHFRFSSFSFIQTFCTRGFKGRGGVAVLGSLRGLIITFIEMKLSVENAIGELLFIKLLVPI